MLEEGMQELLRSAHHLPRDEKSGEVELQKIRVAEALRREDLVGIAQLSGLVSSEALTLKSTAEC